MTEKEMLLAERVKEVLGKEAVHMSLNDIIDELLFIIEGLRK